MAFFLRPGRRSVAKYSRIAVSVVNQSRPYFLPQTIPLWSNKRRCLLVNPLILAASVNGIRFWRASSPEGSRGSSLMFIVYNYL